MIAGEVLSVATAVKLHGEGGGFKEERLVLRTSGGRDQPGQGVRAGAANFPRARVNTRTACCGFIESAAGRWSCAGVSSSHEVDLRAGAGRPCNRLDGRSWRDRRGYCTADCN